MQSIDDYFVSLDMFGVPVAVNYRGRDTYKTRFGALLSLISIALVLTFAIRSG